MFSPPAKASYKKEKMIFDVALLALSVPAHNFYITLKNAISIFDFFSP